MNERHMSSSGLGKAFNEIIYFVILCQTTLLSTYGDCITQYEHEWSISPSLHNNTTLSITLTFPQIRLEHVEK